MNQTEPESLAKILWRNLQGDFKQSLQSGEFEGVVSVAASTISRQVLLVILGPLLGGVAGTFTDYVIRRGIPIARRSFEEWVRGQYTVHTTKTGLAILEKPELALPRRQLATVPKRLVIPTAALIKPTPKLAFRPTFEMRTPLVTTKLRTPVAIRQGVTPLNALLMQGAGQTGLKTARAFDPTTFGKFNPMFKPLTDTVYPSWVFAPPTSLRTARGTHPKFGTAPRVPQDFWKYYMEDPKRARTFQQAVRAVTTSVPERDDRSWLERLIDAIDDLLS